MSHKRPAAAAVVRIVNGALIFKKPAKFTGCSSFFKMPIATTFAEAPKGVRFPPRQEPIKRANIKSSFGMPRPVARDPATGSITIIYGTLSTKPEMRMLNKRMSIKPANLLPPVTFASHIAKSSKRPVSLMAPTTTKIPIRKAMVSSPAPLQAARFHRNSFSA